MSISFKVRFSSFSRKNGVRFVVSEFPAFFVKLFLFVLIGFFFSIIFEHDSLPQHLISNSRLVFLVLTAAALLIVPKCGKYIWNYGIHLFKMCFTS